MFAIDCYKMVYYLLLLKRFLKNEELESTWTRRYHFFFFFLVEKIQEYILEDNFIYKTSFSQYVRLTYMRLTHIYERNV